jgi:hypothetical protein
MRLKSRTVSGARRPVPGLDAEVPEGAAGTDGLPLATRSPRRLPAGQTSSEDALALRVLRSRELVLILCGLGILLRVAQYLANRSLWVDEAWLSLNLVDRPLTALTGPLDFQQAAPVGFLLIEGIITKALGYSEYALRLFPLACGLVSIPAFAWLARRILSAATAAFAIFLFVVADGLIYYSSELKPYETDVAVGLCILVAGIVLMEDVASRGRLALLIAIGGLVLITMSFAGVLVVAAVAGVLTVRLAFDWRRHLLSPASLAVLLWGPAAIGIGIFGLTRARLVRESFDESGRFLGVGGSPSPLHTVNVMATGIATSIGIPEDRPFSHTAKVALVCAVVGAIVLLRRSPTRFSMLVMPFALLLAASAAHAYPILKRTELFLAPVVILFIAEGVAQVIRWLPARARAPTALLLAAVVAGGPVWLAGDRLLHPRTNEETRPVLEFVRDHWRAGDTLYVHYGAQYALLYYEECNCLRLTAPGTRRRLWPLRPLEGQKNQFGQAALPLTHDLVIGRRYDDEDPYIADLDRVRNSRRVWFLYSHLSYDTEDAFIQQDLLGHLASLGTRIGGIDRPGAHAYLYRLNVRG